MPVTGRVAGRRGLIDVVPGLRDLFGEAWGQLVVRIGAERAGVDLVGTGWSPRRSPGAALQVERMDPDPVQWLKDRLADAGRQLVVEPHEPPTAAAAWRLARLRLVFDDRPGATRAVQRGLDHLEHLGGAGADRDDLELLDAQLRQCGCGDAADELWAYLEGPPS